MQRELNHASGYVSIGSNQTPGIKIGMTSGGRSVFAKFAEITSTPECGYIPNGGSWFLLFEKSGCQIDIVYGNFLNAERGQDGFSL